MNNLPFFLSPACRFGYFSASHTYVDTKEE
jgi:hypothetical protein